MTFHQPFHLLVIASVLLSSVKGASPPRDDLYHGLDHHGTFLHQDGSPDHLTGFSQADLNFFNNLIVTPPQTPHRQGDFQSMIQSSHHIHPPYQSDRQFPHLNYDHYPLSYYPPDTYVGESSSQHPFHQESFSFDTSFPSQTPDAIVSSESEGSHEQENPSEDFVSHPGYIMQRGFHGHEWQLHYNKYQQKKIFQTIEAAWKVDRQKSTKNRAIAKLKGLLNRSTAKAILDGDLNTIEHFANETRPLGQGFNKSPAVQQISTWDDEDVHVKKQIIKKLRAEWGGAIYQTVHHRLKTHYDPFLAEYLRSSDPQTFKMGAAMLEAKTEEGKVRSHYRSRD